MKSSKTTKSEPGQQDLWEMRYWAYMGQGRWQRVMQIPSEGRYRVERVKRPPEKK